jgi:hypothetical protein
VSHTQEELEEPRWVDADPAPAAALTANKRRTRKATAPAEQPDTVEGDTEPPMSAQPEPTATGEPDVSGGLAAAEQDEWRAQWLEQLDAALETGDYDAVQSLGSDATRAGADDLVELARDAWTTISGR